MEMTDFGKDNEDNYENFDDYEETSFIDNNFDETYNFDNILNETRKSKSLDPIDFSGNEKRDFLRRVLKKNFPYDRESSRFLSEITIQKTKQEMI